MTESIAPRPCLVVWFPSPPRVELGAFAWLQENWDSPVRLISVKGLREERVGLGWDSVDSSGVEVLPQNASQHVDETVRRVVAESPGALHIFNGMFGAVRPYLDAYLKACPQERVILLSERPGAYGPWRKRTLQKLLLSGRYRRARKELRSRTRLVIPMGEAGVGAFSRVGWPSQQLVPFMYCPPQYEVSPNGRNDDSLIKFIYVGRFSRYTKGTDVLIRSVERMEPAGWSLDLVGGHGDYAEETIAWAASRENVNYNGAWTPEEIQAKIGGYDVCVVPSRFDGWNVVVNEALTSGVPVIATDQTVSHELVRASGAGAVVKAEDVEALASAMTEVTRSTVASWKSLALDYRAVIAPPVVGDYLARTIDFGLGRTPMRPRCPWTHGPI